MSLLCNRGVLGERFVRKHVAAPETFPGRLCAASLLVANDAFNAFLVTGQVDN